MPSQTKRSSLREKSFIVSLEARAAQQRRLAQTEVMPRPLAGIGEWLAVNPWRVLIPVACILYLLMRVVFGTPFRELTLRVFGGY